MSRFCHLVRGQGDAHKCLRCGRVIRSQEATYAIRVECSRPDAPSLVTKARTLTAAVARWLAAGSPVRSDDEQDRILREVCQPCAEWRDGKCGICGCRLKAKVKMATERCPLEKW